MTDQEKIKAYDEVIEKAREWSETKNGYYTPKEFCEEIFPELKESEDEKIKEALIDYFKHHKNGINIFYGINVDDILAWLEKQGEKTIPKDINEAALQYVDTCAVDGEITHDNITEPYWNNHSMMNAYKAGWLEKQGEQKPVVPKFRVGDVITDGKEFPRCTIEEIDEQVYYCDYTNIDIVDADTNWKLVEQKPTDKVEPKFKVGDWVVLSTSDVEKVVRIDSIEYFKSGEPRYITSEGKWFGNGTKAHLWTIQDANDGDVLATTFDEWCKIVIFLSLNNDGVEGYGITLKNGILWSFDCGVPQYSKTWTKCLKPATKEQRDLLFAKMREAGYEWDAEKKESSR